VQAITIEAVTPKSGRALYNALAAFDEPEWDSDEKGTWCFLSVRLRSEEHAMQVLGTIQRHLAERGKPEVSSRTGALADREPH
jgi:hypothetical protein